MRSRVQFAVCPLEILNFFLEFRGTDVICLYHHITDFSFQGVFFSTISPLERAMEAFGCRELELRNDLNAN